MNPLLFHVIIIRAVTIDRLNPLRVQYTFIIDPEARAPMPPNRTASGKFFNLIGSAPLRPAALTQS